MTADETPPTAGSDSDPEKSAADSPEPAPRKRERGNKAGHPQTRKTLIERLDNWEDRRSWDEFYRTYAGFVFNVACKSGLTEAEAADAVQETFLGVAKHLQKKKFDTSVGSFKSFLMNQARWRIMDQLRNRKKETANPGSKFGMPDADDRRTATIDRYSNPEGEAMEKLWDREWQSNLLDLALRRLKGKVSAKQYQIFYCYVVKNWEPEKVREELGVSIAQVYLAKHRVGRLLRKEIEALGGTEPQ